MIDQVRVNGFKSLADFTLDVKPGLNILVGPNGSGKTNIIQFFKLLGDLQEMPVSDAICNAGGVGSVFTKIGEDSFVGGITCCVTGNLSISNKRYLYYRYTFAIALYDLYKPIAYAMQRLEVKFLDSIPSPREEQLNMDMDIEVTRDNENEQPIVSIRNLDRRKIRSEFPRYSSKTTKAEAHEQISRMLSERVGNEESILHGLRFEFDESRAISSDLSGGKEFNIVPSLVRIPEDSAKPPGITNNGSGLYATLYAINNRNKSKASSHRMVYRRNRARFLPRTTMKKVLEYMQLANESVKKITVLNNPFDNQLQIRLWLEGDKESTVLPLSAMSDGTVKWLSLITIILTTKMNYSIEEPENYLHPLMQAEILNVMRANLRGGCFVLLSTHSETLLNNAKPNEVVIVEFTEGRTIARRPKNTSAIQEEIRRTGFGLGYYYIAGSLDE